MQQVELVLGTALNGGDDVVLAGKEAQQHKLVTGVTGSGKSKFLASLYLQLLNQGVGCLLLDPAGDLCDDILTVLIDSGYFVDERSYRRLLYLDFTRPDMAVPLNVLHQPYPPHHTAAMVLEAFKRSWSSLAGGSAPVLEGLVLYGSLVLAINHEPLTRLPSLLTNISYRDTLLENVQDEMALEFFERFSATGGRSTLLSESTTRRVSLFAFDPALRFALGQHDNVLRMRELMDQGVSVLINLGGLNLEPQSFLGCFISTAVEEAALSRVDLPEQRRTPYHFILDEFSQFSSRSAVGLERVLSLTRKYGLSLTLGCQVFGQIPSELQASLGQTTFIGFRLSRTDASWGAELVTTVNRERVKYSPTGRPSYMSPTQQRAEWEDILTTLPTRQALVRLGEETLRFWTLGIPPLLGNRLELQRVKDRYAQLYLTPRTQLERARQNTSQNTSQQQLASPAAQEKTIGRVRRFTRLNRPEQ